MAANLTYTSLLTDIQGAAERSDSAFVAQMPRFVMYAETRIAAEARGLGLIKSVTGNLVVGQSGSVLDKPARWRESVSMFIGLGVEAAPLVAPYNRRQRLKLRSYEYCRQYWADPTQTEIPLYYADWDWAHLLIAPSPNAAFPYEFLYYERPQPLDNNNQSNWTTQYAPQLLFFACMLEASAWVKNKGLIDTWQAGYDRALKQVEFESKQRINDRSQANPKA